MTLALAWIVVREDGDKVIGMAADKMVAFSGGGRSRTSDKITTLTDEDGKTLGYVSASGRMASRLCFTRHLQEEFRLYCTLHMSVETFEGAVRRAYLSAFNEMRALDSSLTNLDSDILIVTKLGIAGVLVNGDCLWTPASTDMPTFEAVGIAQDYVVGYLDACDLTGCAPDEMKQHVQAVMVRAPRRFADSVSCQFDLKTSEFGRDV